MWLGLCAAWAMDVVVTEEPRKDRWSLRYDTGVPVRGLLFARARGPVQPGFKPREGAIVELRDHLAWLAPAGTTASVFEASFPTDTSRRVGDHALNVAFGDGSRLIHTDPLVVIPLVCPGGDGACPDDALELGEPSVHAFELRTADERWVITPSGRSQGWGRWDHTGRGGYLYVGAGDQLPEDRVAFVVDGALPSWVLDRAREWIAPLLDGSTEAMGRSLSFEPVVWLSFDNDRSHEGRSWSSGVLPGQLQLRLGGAGWLEETGGAQEDLARLLAHETFHLWNVEETSTWIDRSEGWLTEGTAEFYAWKALARMGILDAGALAQRRRDQAARCLAAPDAPLLAVPPTSGVDRVFTDCGATELLLLDGRLRAAGSSLDAVWRQVAAEGDAYSTYDLLEVAHVSTQDPLVAADLEHRLRIGAPTAEWMAARLTAAGLPSRVVDPWASPDVGEATSLHALLQTVAACDCAGAVSGWDRGHHLEFDPHEACDALRDGLRVSVVEGGPLLPPGDALARAWAAIDGGGAFTLGDGKHTRTLRCQGVPRPRAFVPY